MPVISHIDGPNRDIYLHADTVGGDVHPIDVYKEMRALRRTDETLRNYDVFLEAKGNEAKGGGKFTERYVICKLGTRIIPYDVTQTLTITGVIITDDAQEGIACFDRTPLTPGVIVDINYIPPQVEVVRAEDELTAIRATAYRGVVAIDVANGVAGTEFPTGTHAQASNNLADALTIAQNEGIEVLVVHGSLTIGAAESVAGYRVEGENPITTQVIVEDGADTQDTQFHDLFLINSDLAPVQAYLNHVFALNIVGLVGFAEGCIFSTACSIGNAQPTYIVDCKSSCYGDSAIVPTFDLSAGDIKLAFRNWSGPIKFINSTSANNSICLDAVSGAKVTLDASCTAGKFNIAGHIGLDDQSTMNVINSAAVDTAHIMEMWMLQGLDPDNPMTVTPTTRTTGAIAQAISGDGTTTSTVTRTP